MWIPSKLTRPSRLHHAISRQRVLDTLRHAHRCKVVLFRSPAGYGKTTMAAQWLADSPAVGWYSIDDGDNDAFRFINYFIQAINIATSNGCPNSQTLAERSQYASISSLFAELFHEIQDVTQPCYLVLDDYHLIDDEKIHEAVRFFIKHMPDNMTVVVTSRSNPPLGIANLRVRDLLIEIDHDMLAFDDDETSRFFSRVVHDEFDSETVSELRHYVEGWPSALQLIALQAKHQNRSLAQSRQSVARFNHDHLWEYLIEEVFAYIDSETRLFLLQCAVLETFNDILVAELTQRSDALNMIESLNRYGLFIHRLESEQNWYRFHHLFAEFLTHQRHKIIPDEEQQLHSRAAQAWLKLDIPHQALKHAQQTDNSDLTTQILLAHGWRMFNHGELNILETAIDELDAEHLYAGVKLPLLQAWLAQSQHCYTRVEDMLTQAEHEMRLRNISISQPEQGQINTLRAQVAINNNDPELASELAELALSQLATTDFRSRIIATSIVGEVNHVHGELNRALSLMQQTEKLARQHQVYHQALWALIQQSEILLAQGYVQAAFELHESAFKLIEAQQLHQVPLHEFLLRLHAQILWCWNSLDEAEVFAQKGIRVLGNLDISKHLHSYSILARIAIARGEIDRAAKFVAQIETLLNQSSYHIDWTANASFALLLYWQVRDDADAIETWLAQASRPSEAKNHFLQLQWRNIARAQIYTGQLEKARQSLAFLQHEAQQSELFTDTNRNLIVEAVLAVHNQQPQVAETVLRQALQMTNQTGMVADFLIEGQRLYPILQQLLQDETLADLEKHRAKYLLREIAQKQRSRSLHFDEEFIDKLLHHPKVPELVRTSPLTQREWQVLGLIYSGFSNEQISQELEVAGTTIKTHIRNLYQKLNLTNRKEAIETAERLLSLMGY
ncbi:HTH-type transcriptional regulator MalT [Vibrio spartinae]|uniref:HTH-type transcriptional regulator MalT n=1 Tax=Vibrio spartinae TaxID=1918945 RepID=A0A1N6M9U0_9VIBR|nr:HTH-type transcriptional regulator MalT [Vibrio spartinae]QMV14698.1 ATP-dependent transcriptional activator MalT [Vibrio spartinae]SIO96127.1 HTH-type transcriptional regulator MalT [Vibrio spartinae]